MHGDVIAHLFQDGLDGAVVLGHARKRTIQVHQVQAACARVHPLARHGGGVFTKGGGLVHIALLEAYAVAVFEVDGGDEQHGGEVRVKKGETQLGPNGWGLRDQGFQCRKLRYRARPCSALFSG